MDAKSALTNMTRIAQRRGLEASKLERGLGHNLDMLAPIAVEVGLETGDPIGKALATLLAQGKHRHLAPRLHGLIPDDTLCLRELALVVTEQYLSALSQEPPGPAHANLLNNLAVRRLSLGFVDNAMRPAREAVQMYRVMEKGRPDLFRPGLAMSLNTLSVILANSGDFDGALKAARESVAAYRLCVAENTESHGRVLAQSLNTLANRYLQMGHWGQALAAVEESNSLYESFDAARRWPADLARARNTLSYALARCGRLDEAIKKGEDALHLYEELAEAQADAYQSLLALCQSNQAGILIRQGRYETALMLAEHSVKTYAGMVANRTEAFRSDFATALCVLGISQCATKKYSESEDSLRQLLRMLEPLAGEQPFAYLPLKAEALRTLGMVLIETGRDAEAVRSAEQAVAIYANLPPPIREAHIPELARADKSLADILFVGDRLSEAARAMEETIILYRLLNREEPAVFQNDLISALTGHAHVMLLSGDYERAFDDLREVFVEVVPRTFEMPDGVLTWQEIRRGFLARASRASREELDDPIGLLRACVAAEPTPTGPSLGAF